MAGHTITPYELVANRKWARKNKDVRLLLAAEMAKDGKGTADLLDVVEAHVTSVDPTVTNDGSRSVECVLADRRGDFLDMVFACDVTGERELVMDPAQGLVVFKKGPEHVARYYSCSSIWRPPAGDAGLLLVHSPWGRGGSKSQILSVIQRAVNQDADVSAKLTASPKIPHKVLDRLLRNANATRITYTKSKGIRSEFDQVTGRKSAPAEMALVVKGSDTVPFRDALTHALRAAQNRDKFFTVEIRDPGDGSYRKETFDDVEITIDMPGGSKTYSMRQDTIPTMGFDFTRQVNKIYLALPDDDHTSWAQLLHEGTTPFMDSVQLQVEAGS